MYIQGDVCLSGDLIDFIKDFATPKEAILSLLDRDEFSDYPKGALMELLTSMPELCEEDLPWMRILSVEPNCYTLIPKKRRNKVLLHYAIYKDPLIVSYLQREAPEELTEDVWIEAVESWPYSLRYYDGNSEDVFIAAVKARPQLINAIKDPSPKVCAAAVSEYMRRAVELSRVVKKWD